MKDCWHFITKKGFIFTIRGDIHPKGKILSIGIYCLDKKGNREYNGKKYSKKVDEYGEKWVKEFHPEYIIKNDFITQILVPEEDIDKYFNPFEISDEAKEKMKKTKWGNLILVLEELIPKEDIGFIGSYLIGFPTEKSDIDILIRGLDNLRKIKENLDYILRKLNATNDLGESLTKISLEKYYGFYSKDKNNFSKMIKNRWPTIRTPEYMTKLRFTPKDNEIDFPILKDRLSNIEIKGNVIDDLGINFMPRFFKIKTNQVEYTIVTYFWDYAYCVKKGDEVIVNGDLFENNIIAINNKTNHGVKFN